MARPRPLRDAPIVEAIVDFRVPPNPKLDPESLKELRAALATSFPKEEVRQRREAQIGVGDDGILKANVRELGFHGLFLRSEDNNSVVQFRPDGFSYSKLKPYTNWAEVRDQAFEYWEMYAAIARPSAVVRVALRYINRMAIPLSHGADFGTYLVGAPIVPPALPQLVSHFLNTIVLHEPKHELQANVTQALEQSTADNMLVVFDIDAYRQHDFDADLKDLRPVFEALHAFKNDIFFEYLTEVTLEAFA